MDQLLATPTTLGADPAHLVSFWKALLLFLPIVGWAWVVATILDKDAQRFYFKRRQWNIFHVCMGAAALAVGLFVPIFWAALPALVVVLIADLGVYFVMRNKDDRVGETQRWSLNVAKQISESAESRAKRKKLGKSEIEIRGPSGVVAPPDEETPEYQTRLIAEGFAASALDARATRFDVAPSSEGAYAVGLLVDGVRQIAENIPAAQAVGAIDYLRAAAGMDVAERRKRQTAELHLTRTDVKHKLRMTSQGVPGGQRLSVRINPEGQVQHKLEDLGLLQTQEEELRKIVQEQKGVVLLGAPAGAGRTSAMYAILRSHDAYTSNVQTLELEPEAYIDGVKQNIFDPKVDGAEFSTTVRSLLRRDPDVLAVAEAPDAETIKEIAKADHGRTRTYLSLRAENALQALQIYVKAVGDPAQAAKGLYGLVSQRLLRRLCPNCKAAYQPTPDMLRKLGLPDKVQTLYRKGGQVLIKNKPEVCPVCNGGGYFGQDGCFEVHSIDNEERALIAQSNFGAVRDSFRKKRQPSIQESALRKAIEGITSVEEVVRITAKPAAPAAQGAQGAAGAGAKPASRQARAPSSGETPAVH